MNRQPRTEEAIFKWHRETLAHIATHGEKDRGRPPMSENEPQCGFFIRRLVAKGPYVPCRIWIEIETDPETGDLTCPEKMRCEVDCEPRDAAREWTWLCGHPITEDKYYEMLEAKFAGPREASQPVFVAKELAGHIENPRSNDQALVRQAIIKAAEKSGIDPQEIFARGTPPDDDLPRTMF